MKFGLDVGVYGKLATQENILALATFADAAGFDSLWLADHVVFPTDIRSRYPYSPSGDFPVPTDDPILEPIATMGVLIGATKHVRIGTAVLVVPYRNPVLLARMLITLDVLSKGRVILGAGTGWLAEEFEALDSRDFKARGAVTDEWLEIYKRLSAGGQVSFDGEHYHLRSVYSAPRSVQRPHPPIFIGGTSNPALRRVARLGDGWLSVGLAVEDLGERLLKLKALCVEQDRKFDEVMLYHKLFISIGEARAGHDGRREPGTGSLAQVRDDLKKIADLGYESIIVRDRSGDATIQDQQLRQFVDDVMPHVMSHV
ncbi:MAG: LLM class F420-dependent oxidoreductase [Gammaproteobacteria bacterium]|nr:LLM class F420-dependent oxidoreductase [Gammaproteobacteria bacterium]